MLRYFIILFFSFSVFVPSSWAQNFNWPWTMEGENFEITTDSGDNFSPAIASACQDDSCFYFVVWSKRTSSGYTIYGARVQQDGTVQDEDGIPICTAKNDQMFPSVASDGRSFFVVWQDMRSGKRWEIYGARVTFGAQGPEVDEIPIAVGKSKNDKNDQVSPAVAYNGQNFLVVWQGRQSPKVWNLFFRRVSLTGDLLDGAPIRLAPSQKDQVSPAVAFNGVDYFVVWQDFRSGKFWDIYGATVTPSGDVLETNGVPISPIAGSGSYDKWGPVLSWDGSSFLVIWKASPTPETPYLEGKQVGDGGVRIFDIRIPLSDSNKVYPAILWSGSDYLLVWEEEPEGEPKILATSILPSYFQVSDTKQISSSDIQNPAYPGISRIWGEILIVWQGIGEDKFWHIYGQRLKKSE